MNRAVSKSKKTMAGLILSILLSVMAVIFAVNDNGYWVLFVLAALWTLFFGIRQADKVTKAGAEGAAE